MVVDEAKTDVRVLSDPVPYLLTAAIPDREREETRYLMRLLNDLRRYSNSFKAAFRLFEHAREMESSAGAQMAVCVQQMMANPASVDPKAVSRLLKNDLGAWP